MRTVFHSNGTRFFLFPSGDRSYPVEKHDFEVGVDAPVDGRGLEAAQFVVLIFPVVHAPMPAEIFISAAKTLGIESPGGTLVYGDIQGGQVDGIFVDQDRAWGVRVGFGCFERLDIAPQFFAETVVPMRQEEIDDLGPFSGWLLVPGVDTCPHKQTLPVQALTFDDLDQFMNTL